MRHIALALALTLLATPALAHGWYSKKTDPVYGDGCCGNNDCEMWAIQPGELEAVEHGFRVRLSHERTMQFNPGSRAAIDALVIWERVQPSEDGN
jgi:hypothetical protein